MNILFVCTGNTCRSPMAEGLFKKIAEDACEVELNVYSGGMSAVDGNPVNENAVKALLEYDVDISEYRSKNVDAGTIAEADIILTMTRAHKDMLLYLFGGAAEEKTYTLMEYIGEEGDVEDPYGGDLRIYRICAKRIYDALVKAYDVVKGEFDV